MFARASINLVIAAALLSYSTLPATAADVTVRIQGENELASATVILNTDDGKWSGADRPVGALLKGRSGRYQSGTNVTSGFAVKGTALLVGSDGNEVEAYFYNLIPRESKVGDTGDVLLRGTTKNGKWTIR